MGEGVLWRDVPLDRVRRLTVVVGAHRHVVELTDGLRPVYFIQHWKHINLGTGGQTSAAVVVVGYQMRVRGVNVRCLTHILADGTVVVSDRDPTKG